MYAKTLHDSKVGLKLPFGNYMYIIHFKRVHFNENPKTCFDILPQDGAVLFHPVPSVRHTSVESPLNV